MCGRRPDRPLIWWEHLNQDPWFKQYTLGLPASQFSDRLPGSDGNGMEMMASNRLIGRISRQTSALPPPSKTRTWLPLLLLLTIILFVSLIRVRLLSFPLERDEGEYAYFGQLILQGIPPYSMAYNLKLPGTYCSYALIMAIFGQSIRGIHLGLLAFNLGSMLLVYSISKRLFDVFVGLIATAAFGLISLSPTLLGQAAHANHFVTFYMLAGFCLLLLATDKRSNLYGLFAGILMGLAFLSKQPGLLFGLFGALAMAILLFKPRASSGQRPVSFLLVYGIGLALPVGFVMLAMWLEGVFDKFWFWTVLYPPVYGSRIPVTGAWAVFRASFPAVASVFTSLWIMAGLGAPALLFSPGETKSRVLAGLFLSFSILSCIPGFHFRPHYFLPLVPAVGLMAGVFLETVNERARRHLRYVPFLTVGGFLIAAAAGLYMQRAFFFETDLAELSRTLYKGNPFTESLQIAGYVRQNTQENDRIFVFGSEPQIFFYSGRKSATGYIYMYDLAYSHRYLNQMQAEMIREVERSSPRMIVYVSTHSSWLAQGKVVDPLSDWLKGYFRKYRFVPVCYADIVTPSQTVYTWGEAARSYQRKSDNCVVVFRREGNY